MPNKCVPAASPRKRFSDKLSENYPPDPRVEPETELVLVTGDAKNEKPVAENEEVENDKMSVTHASMTIHREMIDIMNPGAPYTDHPLLLFMEPEAALMNGWLNQNIDASHWDDMMSIVP